MGKRLKAVLYGILPILMIVLCASMITYIFAATKSELLISGKIGYEREKGTGTEEDPFLIYSIGSSSGNAEQGSFNFYAGKNTEGKNYFASTSPQYYFKQANDLAGSNFTQTTLNGFYDGNNYEFDASGGGAIFQGVGDEVKAELRDLTVRNINSTDTAGVAGYVGSDGVIDSVTFTGSINYSGTETYVAGITRVSMGGTIKNCVNYANIVGTRDVAGIIADFDTASIENCRNFGNITSTTSGGYAGGIVGYGMYQYIKNSYNTGEIIGDNAGGIAGLLCNGTSVIDSYNTGEVQGTVNAGGVVGIIDEYGATITNCYNSGKIASGSGYVGGIVGNHTSGPNSNEKCYNLGTLETTGTKGGILGYDNPCSAMITSCYSVKSSNEMTGIGGLGSIAPVGTTLMPEAMKSLTQLQTQSTYSGWTFGTYGTATSGWCFVASEILVDGEVQRLVLPRLAWEELTVIPTYNVTLNANGGRFDQETTEMTRYVPDNITFTNSNGFTQATTLNYSGSVSGTSATYAMMKIAFTAQAGDSVSIGYTFTKGSYGTCYMYLSALNSTFTASAYTESSYAVRKTATASNQTYTHSITTSGTNYFYVKLYKAYYSLSSTSSVTVTINQTTETETTTTDITTLSATVCEGGYIDLPNAYKANCSILGFNTSSTATTPTHVMDGTKFYPTASGTYYAVWTANTYAVTLNKQSGSGGTSSVTATYGSAMPSATAPTRSGYTFGGYYTGTNGTGTQYYTASMASARTWNLTSNTTLYAKWTASNFTVTFDANGGTIGGYTVESVSGASYGFALNSDGYYESQNKGEDSSAALCKVSFYATAGSTVTFTVINYAESNYDFGLLGYLDGTAMSTSYSDVSTGVEKSFKGSSQSNTQTYSYSISSTGNHYVYVKYRKDGSDSSYNDSFQFKITSGVGDGSTTTSLTVSAGGTISTLPFASRNGYTFNGWYTSTSGGTQLTTSTAISSSRTYYAQWTYSTSYECICEACTNTVSDVGLCDSCVSEAGSRVCNTCGICIAHKGESNWCWTSTHIGYNDGYSIYCESCCPNCSGGSSSSECICTACDNEAVYSSGLCDYCSDEGDYGICEGSCGMCFNHYGYSDWCTTSGHEGYFSKCKGCCSDCDSSWYECSQCGGNFQADAICSGCNWCYNCNINSGYSPCPNCGECCGGCEC